MDGRILRRAIHVGAWMLDNTQAQVVTQKRCRDTFDLSLNSFLTNIRTHFEWKWWPVHVHAVHVLSMLPQCNSSEQYVSLHYINHLDVLHEQMLPLTRLLTIFWVCVHCLLFVFFLMVLNWRIIVSFFNMCLLEFKMCSKADVMHFTWPTDNPINAPEKNSLFFLVLFLP